MEFRGQLWFHHTQIWIQSGLFGLWLVALALSVAALWRPRSPRFHRVVRALWMVAMAGFLGFWLYGATLEMMRRTAPISWKGLVVALAAFSLLVAGAVSLARECFDETRCLRPGRIVLTLLALTLAGCFFGGFALPLNALFETGFVTLAAHSLPKGWMLALCGAQLLTVAHTLEPKPDSGAVVRSPREATVWLAGFLLILGFWNFDGNRLVVLAAYVGFGPFLIRTWSVRLNWKRRGETTIWVASALMLGAIGFAFRGALLAWSSQIATSWLVWPHDVACGVLAVLLMMLWRMPVSFSLKLATHDSRVKAALLLSTLTGAIASTVFFGPSAAVWWSFWPLAGLFFDLLHIDDEHERKWKRLAALKARLHAGSGSANGDADEPGDGSQPDSGGTDRAPDEPVELSAAGRQVEDG